MATRDIIFQVQIKNTGPSLKDTFDQGAKAAKDAAKETATSMKQIEQATKSAKSAAETYSKTTEASNKNVADGAKKAAEGFMALGRALGFAGVATSKDMEAAVRVFSKFQAGADVFKGVLDVVEGGQKIWQTYTALSKAAAAADLAAAAAARTRAAASAASGVASAAGGAASAAGSAAGAGGAIAGIVTALGPLGLALAAFGVAVAAVTFFMDDSAEEAKKTAEKYRGILNSSNKLIEINDREQQKRYQQFESNSMAREAAAYRGDAKGLSGRLNEASYQSAKEKLTYAQQWNTIAQRDLGRGGSEDQDIALEDNAVKAASYLVSAQKQMLEAEKAKSKERENQINQEISIRKDLLAEDRSLLDKKKAEREAEENKLKSAQERFIEADPMQQQRLLQAVEAGKNGKDLSNEQRQELKSYGLYGDMVDKDTQKRLSAMDPNVLKTLFGDQKQKIADFDKEIATREDKIKKQENDIKLLEAALEAVPRQLADVLTPLVQGLSEQTKAEMEQSLRNKSIRDRYESKASTTG